MSTRLRVFPEPLTIRDEDGVEPTIRVRLGDLLPLIAVAKKNNYLWLQDFVDDEVAVSPYLYDVLQAFAYHRRPSA